MSSRRGQKDVIAAEAGGSPYPEEQTWEMQNMHLTAKGEI